MTLEEHTHSERLSLFFVVGHVMAREALMPRFVPRIPFWPLCVFYLLLFGYPWRT